MVWHKAHELVLKVYEISKIFPKEEIYGLTNQLRRCSISIAANIAEGCGKLTQNDTANFFQISLGSLHETEYYILLSRDLKFISESQFQDLDNQIREIKAMLISLIKKVRSSKQLALKTD